MSDALYEIGGLRFWNESEIELRELFQQRIISVVKNTLAHTNPMWNFARVEGPILTFRNDINPSYDDNDIFITNHEAKSDILCLRPETTLSSYVASKKVMRKKPFCVYQSGKSFRREKNDGASASKMRYNEFWQLEFQCLYNYDTKMDYRQKLIESIIPEIERFTSKKTRVVNSDRLPSYSQSTLDIEVNYNNVWYEVASCSIRTDYPEKVKNTIVCEIAIGLDRIVTLSNVD